MSLATATSFARKQVRARIAMTHAVCETLEQRRLLSANLWQQPWQRLNPPGNGGIVARPPQPEPPLTNIGTVGASPVNVNSHVPAGMLPFQMNFYVSQPITAEIKMTTSAPGLTALLVNSDGRPLGQLKNGESLNTFLAKDAYTLRFSNPGSARAMFGLDIVPTQDHMQSAPTRVEAEALGGNGARIIWIDNSDNELGYRVELYDQYAKSWNKVGMAAPNDTAAIVHGLRPGQRHQFRVSAISKEANGQWAAISSTNIAMATTSLTETSGWYLVGGINYQGKGYAGWEEYSNGVAQQSPYSQGEWIAGSNWTDAVLNTMGGDFKVRATSALGAYEEDDIVTHRFPSGGDIKVGTGADLAASGSGVTDFKLPADDTKYIVIEDTYTTYDRDYDDWYWTVTQAERQSLDSLDLEAKDPVHSANWVADGERMYIEEDSNGKATVRIDAMLSQNTAQHRKHTHWKLYRGAELVDEGTFEQTSFNIELNATNNDRSFRLIAGFDNDASGADNPSNALSESEVMQEINFTVVNFLQMVVTSGTNQQATCVDEKPVLLFVSETEPGGGAMVTFSAVANPNTADAKEHIHWRLHRGGGHTTFGDFQTAEPFLLVPNESGNRHFVLEAGFDDDMGNVADTDEITRTMHIYLLPAGTPQWLLDMLNALARDCDPVELAQTNPAAMGGSTLALHSTIAPIRYANGLAQLSWTDLASGFADGWGHTRSWNNQDGFGLDAFNGSGTVVSQSPQLLQFNDEDIIIAVGDGTTARTFAKTDGNTYQGAYFIKDKLEHVGSEFILTDTSGNKIIYHDFSVAAELRGKFKGFESRTGLSTSVASTNAAGRPTEMTKTDSISGVTESYLYSYVSGGVNDGLLASVTLQRKPSAVAPYETVRQVEYTYYGSAENYGNTGDLKLAEVKTPAGAIIDTRYYRYYKSEESGGFESGLKYVFNPQSFERLKAAVGSPFSATDVQVAPYADNYFEYDAQRRVTKEIAQGEGCSSCTGGQGTFYYSYQHSSHVNDMANWKYKTVETLPDGNTNTVYSNYAGLVILKVFEDNATDQEFRTFYKYDTLGRLLLEAGPSAVTGHDETKPDLLNEQNGNYQYLSDSTGLIVTQSYYDETTATSGTAGGVDGYIAGASIQRGELGTPVKQREQKYIERSADATVYPVAEQTVYQNDNGTGALTTRYEYTWYDGTTQEKSQTVKQPVVTTAQNGSGTQHESITYFDRFGRPEWIQDESGYIHHLTYDAASGGLTGRIVDVDTVQVSGEPTGWITPGGGGAHLVTTFEVDALGRATKTIDPNGNVTYSTYNDADHEVRIYAGWNSTTHLPTGPTIVLREDRAGSYTEMLTMTAAPDLDGQNQPTGDEAVSGIQSLSRAYANVSGQLVKEDTYFDLTGLTYSTAPDIGTGGVHYNRSEYAYDKRGRVKRIENPNGTITRTRYDGLARATELWIGTDDTGFTDTSNGTGNMTQVAAYEYDNGGIGDGTLTQITHMPGGSEADRIIENFYDWRNRLVASKNGVQTSESGDTQRPISYVVYNNLGRITVAETYDGDGWMISDLNGDGIPNRPYTGLLRGKTTIDYDNLGRAYASHTFSVDPSDGTISNDSLTSQVWFDARGNVIKTAFPTGLVAKTSYDGAGRPVAGYSTNGGGDSSWTDAGNVIGDVVLEQSNITYDDNSNVIAAVTRQRFHDATGTGVLDAANSRAYHSVSYYDALNRTTADVNVGTNGGSAYARPGTAPARSDTTLVTSYSYNAAGWLDQATDPKDVTTKFNYDAAGRTTQAIEAYTNGVPTDSTNRITQYTYDGLGNITRLTAVLPTGQADQTTQYVYGVSPSLGSAITSNDLLLAVRYPDKTTGQPSTGEQETFTYNALGQTKTKADRNGNIHGYTYDVLGRLLSDEVTTLGTGVDGAVRKLSYTFNTQGLVEKLTSHDGSGDVVNQVQRAYNGLGQLVTEYQAHNGAVNTATSSRVGYTHSAIAKGSRPTGLIYPDGRVLNYTYGTANGLNDRISRLDALVDDDGTTRLEGFSYLGLGTVVERTHDETGIDLTYIGSGSGDGGDQYTGLDRFGRIIDQRWTDGTADVDRFTYGYDRNSNRTSKDNTLDSDFDETYTYDTLNRLTTFDRADGHDQSWALDALGNSDTVTTDGTPQTRTHNAQNQLTNVGGASLTFDANGNTTTDQHGNTLVYDAWNRLVEAKDGSTSLVRYEHDALGRRIEEGQTRVYFSAGWQAIDERDGSGNKTQYVWSPVYIDAMILRDRDTNADGTVDERLYVQQDANFNVTSLTNDSGQVVERYVYDPYGKQTVLEANWSLDADGQSDFIFRHGHQGGKYDAVLPSQMLFRHRIYDVELMRWYQQDPLGYVDGMNLNVAYRSNPTALTDPSGTESIIQNPVGNFLDYMTGSVVSGWIAASEARDLSHEVRADQIMELGSAKGADADQVNRELRRGGMDGFAAAAENTIHATGAMTTIGLGGGPGTRAATSLGHALDRHGSHCTEFLLNRLKNSSKLQRAGQFLDNAAAEQWLTSLAKTLGPGEHLVPLPAHVPGRIMHKSTGQWEPATHAMVVIHGNGIRTAYPEVP